MTRKLLCSLLFATLLWQGWAQASVSVAEEPAPQQDRAGHMTDSGECDCCPGDATDLAACQVHCSGGVALTSAPAVIHVAASQAPHSILAEPRAGPAYLPLNPPPIS